ncbi:putative Zn-binding protein involved in type VI secretion [Silvimonas terrae]|uniref:Putative Zn-binding protein involved in type VI secretion n=1 Tax=Silvimonas terrae TaxID=300266 RepID=A0A840REM9_9NEIS|nr:PAAR domain-containing protein [Silvimonas terrae]MBB5191457.1 putative Zn-binding protein involved in type VI secretion [Silvimonas terrae]
MTEIRYALRYGDKTTRGGMLIASGNGVIHHNAPVGIEGDIATCPQCHSTGAVYNDCQPDFNIEGKQVLVSGAKVYCKCPNHPIMLPSRHDFIIHVNREKARITPAKMARQNSAGDLPFNLQFLIKSKKTQLPQINTSYKITLESGEEFIGTTDLNGLTQIVSASYAANAKIEVPYHDNNTTAPHDTDHGTDPCCCDHS